MADNLLPETSNEHYRETLSDQTYTSFTDHVKAIDEDITVRRARAPDGSNAIVLRLKDASQLDDEGRNSFRKVADLGKALRKADIENNIMKVAGDPSEPEKLNITELTIKTGKADIEDKLKAFLGLTAGPERSATDQFITNHVSSVRQMTRNAILSQGAQQPVDTAFATKLYAEMIDGLQQDAKAFGVDKSVNALLSKSAPPRGR